MIVLTPAVTAHSVSCAERLLAIGRFGVGYDGVDVEACTQADVVAVIATGSVDRSVAEATVGWMIALAHHTRIKDRLVRTGQWDQRSGIHGHRVARSCAGHDRAGRHRPGHHRAIRGFGMKTPLAFDPLVDPAVAESLGVRLVGLDQLLREADFVSVHCPLNRQTRGLIGRSSWR